MADDAELQAKIAAIAGRINQHKTHQQQPIPTMSSASRHPVHHNNRWHPYQSNKKQFKNRSLVVAKSTDAHSHSDLDMNGETQPFVKTRGTNNQLMTKSTYEREQHSRTQYKKQTRSTQHQQSIQERQKLAKHFSQTNASRVLQIDGIQFEMKADGSKLTRVSGKRTNKVKKTYFDKTDQSSDGKTPRKAVIAGVEFLRTKNGNLLRKGALKDSIRMREQQRLQPQCEHFTKNGNCPYGPRCKFAHDPAKVAMCKTFLRTGNCLNGDFCDLSHDSTYHRVSACTHFQNLQCNNADCRYPHIRIKPGSPVCRAFATLGYCDAGPACKNRHVHECPDYANNGSCPKLNNCPLPHVLRASTQRAARKADVESEIDESDAHDDHDLDSDDLSEDLVMAGRDDSGVSLADNDDFVPFI